jgi:hypothetical protein
LLTFTTTAANATATTTLIIIIIRARRGKFGFDTAHGHLLQHYHQQQLGGYHPSYRSRSLSKHPSSSGSSFCLRPGSESGRRRCSKKGL